MVHDPYREAGVVLGVVYYGVEEKVAVFAGRSTVCFITATKIVTPDSVISSGEVADDSHVFDDPTTHVVHVRVGNGTGADTIVNSAMSTDVLDAVHGLLLVV